MATMYTNKAEMFANALDIELPEFEDAAEEDEWIDAHEDAMPAYLLDGGHWSAEEQA